MNIQKISFKGIYDIRYPKDVTDEKINQDQARLIKTFGDVLANFSYGIEKRYNFRPTSTLSEKGIRLVTSEDDPFVMSKILKMFRPELASQYINQTKKELVIDTIA